MVRAVLRRVLIPLLLLAGPGCKSDGAPAADAPAPSAAAAAPTATTESVIAVEGMVCGGCEGAIEQALGKVDGVASADASHTDKRVVVRYDAARVTPQQLEKVITDLGYTVPPPSLPLDAPP